MLASWLQPPVVGTELVTPRDVGGFIAWQSLHLDGFLVHLWGQHALRAGSDPDPNIRARALRGDRVPRTVIGRQSAVWVFTGERISPLVHLIYDPAHHRPAPLHGRATHQTVLLAEDVLEVSGVPVTSPARTAMDCAMHLPRATAIHAIRHLGPWVSLEEIRDRTLRAPRRSSRDEPLDVIDRALA